MSKITWDHIADSVRGTTHAAAVDGGTLYRETIFNDRESPIGVTLHFVPHVKAHAAAEKPRAAALAETLSVLKGPGRPAATGKK